ncbi:unnamed protein product, partial [Iphiclides podalirius]
MASNEAPLEKSDDANGRSSVSGTGSHVKLRRELGLFSAVNLILGVMIGSGIFISPASALEHSGSVALCLIIWTVSGVISLLGALSFAELGTVLGKSGAEYSYFQEAFGNCHKYWGPLPSFLCAWIYVVEELIAYTKGLINDYNVEIERLENLLHTAKEATSRPRVIKKDIHPQHIQKAKARFQMMKNELHGLIQSLYPNSAGLIKDILGQLMQEKLDETSNGYIQFTTENYPAIEVLKDMQLVSTNPYNNSEVKLVY